MKKISKLLLSICLLFVLSFSLTACMGGNNNKNSGSTKPKGYTPPEDVDMTSGVQYAEWLLANHTNKDAYTMLFYKSKNGTVQESGSLKYYKDEKTSTFISASYNSAGTITYYREFKDITDNTHTVTIYDVTNSANKSYKVYTWDNDRFTTFKNDEFYADSVIYHYLYDYEQWDTTGATEITAQQNIVKDTETDGKYILTNTVLFTYENGDENYFIEKTYKYTVVKDKIIDVTITTEDSRTRDVEEAIYTYTYETVKISFSKKGIPQETE